MKQALHPEIKGKLIDNYSRCVHDHSSLDVIAIRFKCCGEYYPCHSCHEEEVDHEPRVWMKSEFEAKAVLCGVCKNEMSITDYLNSHHHCPFCNVSFNPNCSNHYHLYFEV
jgi:uncharacterized CHY-type Zn-finger protein